MTNMLNLLGHLHRLLSPKQTSAKHQGPKLLASCDGVLCSGCAAAISSHFLSRPPPHTHTHTYMYTHSHAYAKLPNFEHNGILALQQHIASNRPDCCLHPLKTGMSESDIGCQLLCCRTLYLSIAGWLKPTSWLNVKPYVPKES